MGVTRLLLLGSFYYIQTNFLYFFAHDCKSKIFQMPKILKYNKVQSAIKNVICKRKSIKRCSFTNSHLLPVIHTGCLIVKWWKLNGSEGQQNKKFGMIYGASGGLEFCVSSTSFQKSNISRPQHSPTEKLLKFNLIFHDSTKKFFFAKHKKNIKIT